jgi:hypothetical protein
MPVVHWTWYVAIGAAVTLTGGNIFQAVAGRQD